MSNVPLFYGVGAGHFKASTVLFLCCLAGFVGQALYYGYIAPGVIAGRGAHHNGAVNVKATAANTPETKPCLQAHRLMSFIDRNGSPGQVACFDVSTL